MQAAASGTAIKSCPYVSTVTKSEPTLFAKTKFFAVSMGAECYMLIGIILHYLPILSINIIKNKLAIHYLEHYN